MKARSIQYLQVITIRSQMITKQYRVIHRQRESIVVEVVGVEISKLNMKMNGLNWH